MSRSRVTIIALLSAFAFAFCTLPGHAQEVTEVYCSTDVPLLVPPVGTSGTTFSNLTVPDAGQITDVTVSLQIDHTFISDLEISVISPQSTEPVLVDNVGGSGDNFGTGCSPPNFILDDAAGTSVTTYTAGTAGTFSPFPDPLSFFDGEDQFGNWTLVVNDQVGGDSGQLNCWCLTITRLNLLPPLLSVLLSPVSSVNPLFTSHTVTATVLGNGLPVADELVEFEIVSGPNSGLTSVPNNGECSPNNNCTTDANGVVSWSYFGEVRGTDRIVARVDGGTVSSDLVEKIWEPVRNVPTLSEWGLIAMAGILGLAALMVMRRKKVNA